MSVAEEWLVCLLVCIFSSVPSTFNLSVGSEFAQGGHAVRLLCEFYSTLVCFSVNLIIYNWKRITLHIQTYKKKFTKATWWTLLHKNKPNNLLLSNAKLHFATKPSQYVKYVTLWLGCHYILVLQFFFLWLRINIYMYTCCCVNAFLYWLSRELYYKRIIILMFNTRW